VKPKREREVASANPRVMGTRFRPADPEAVRRRFAAIRTRALERVAEEQRAILAKLARDRWVEQQQRDEETVGHRG
jgi:hypothetical protein